MITGLVYMELDGNGNQQDEAFRIRRSLAQWIRQRQKKAWSEEREARQQQADDYKKALCEEKEARQAESAAQKEGIQLLENQMEILTIEVIILH
ncbi:hypothetical protein HOY82DRAFT_612365 [Tuber indicum]|nr:hypothetical protein HOY82DRAFT_612365 [Tuber indicum]